MYETKTTHYLQHCNKKHPQSWCVFVAWEMVGRWTPSPRWNLLFLAARRVVTFCWYLLSETKSTNNARDAINTMVYGLPGFLSFQQCYYNSQYPTKKNIKQLHWTCSKNLPQKTKTEWSQNWCHPNHLMSLLACKLWSYQYQWCTIVPTLCPSFSLEHHGKGEGSFFLCRNNRLTWNKGIIFPGKSSPIYNRDHHAVIDMQSKNLVSSSINFTIFYQTNYFFENPIT